MMISGRVFFSSSVHVIVFEIDNDCSLTHTSCTKFETWPGYRGVSQISKKFYKMEQCVFGYLGNK